MPRIPLNSDTAGTRMSSAIDKPQVPHDLLAPLINAQRIVVFTGAGMSAESGIATFRDKPDSLWAKFNTREMASPDGWREDKNRVWAWYEGRRGAVLQTQPNAGHMAIAELSATLQGLHGQPVQVDVITQNVDNLHERAGSTSVTHVHGSLFEPRCIDCERPGEFAPGEPDQSLMSLEPPHCAHCNGYIRPGVVWFGEAMPLGPFRRAEDLVDLCNSMLVVGTSGVVWPAAELPISAHNLGKFTAEINPTPSGLAKYMRVQWPSTAAAGLPALINALKNYAS
jgi:NAD-dependent deacetylase